MRGGRASGSACALDEVRQNGLLWGSTLLAPAFYAHAQRRPPLCQVEAEQWGGCLKIVRRLLRLRLVARWGCGYLPFGVRVGVGGNHHPSPVSCHPEAGGGGMATASGSSDLSGSGAPPPGGEVQAAAAEEEEREVVRVRVKVRLTAGQPAHPGLPGEKKAVAVL